MKPKRQDPLARRNRANKNRGRDFENRCAKVLGWTRVPYSGAQAGWGKGDVVDGFYTRNGFWQAECKITIGQKTGLSINGKWIKQMNNLDRVPQHVAGIRERHPVLFLARKGSPRSWALLPAISWDWLHYKMIEASTYTISDAKPTEKGTFMLPQNTLDGAWNGHIQSIDVGGMYYYLISFPYFVELVCMLDAHKPIETPDEAPSDIYNDQ